jgi:hypothetical protein
MQRGHIVERFTPLLAAFGALGIGGPDVHTPGHAGTPEDGLIRRDPDERRIVLGLPISLFRRRW